MENDTLIHHFFEATHIRIVFDYLNKASTFPPTFLLYQVATATASPKYVKPPLFSKKVAVFEYMLYY